MSRGPTSSRPPGRRRPAGWWSSTRSTIGDLARGPRRPSSPPAARPRRRVLPASCATCVQGDVGRGHPATRLRLRPGPPGWDARGQPPRRARPGRRPAGAAPRPTSTSGSRASSRGPPPLRTARAASAPSPGCRRLQSRDDAMTPASGSTARPSSGAAGCQTGLPRPSLADPPAALSADAQGADVLAHRRDSRRRPPRCRRPLAASATGTTATPGSATPPSRCGRCTYSGSTSRLDDFARFIGDICRQNGAEIQIMYGIGGERELTESTLDHLYGYGGARPVRIGNGGLRPAPERRLGRADRLALHPREGRTASPTAVGSPCHHQVEEALRTSGRSPTRGSGRPAASQALRLVEADVLGGARPRRPAGPATAATDAAERWGGIADRDQGGHPRARRLASAASSASTTTPMLSTHRPC